jgi:glutamine synthetase type III
MATLSERIGILSDAADQLRSEVKKLRMELNNRDGIEAIQHLADVPGDLLDAEEGLRKAAVNLGLAREDATLGGE